MQIIKDFSVPLNHRSKGILSLLEKLMPSHCRLLNYSNEVTVDLTDSGFTSIGGEILSTQGEIVFQHSAIEQMQAEFKIDDQMLSRIWICFSDSTQLEIFLKTEQVDDFWYLIQCLELDTKPYRAKLYARTMTGQCPCCIKRVEKIRSETRLHPVALILAEIADGLAGDVNVKIELGEEYARASHSLKIESVKFHRGEADINTGNIKLCLASIHGIKLFKEVIDESAYMSLCVFNSYGDYDFKISIQSCSLFQQWMSYLKQTTLYA